jgi:hypothetical protein
MRSTRFPNHKGATTMDQYKIYLVNQSMATQVFWCFLQPPRELSGDPGVFANSSASLAVRPDSPAQNSFVIPAQYMVGAGASNHAVGLNVRVISNVTMNAGLQDTWQADYANVPPNMGPRLIKAGTQAPANTIAIASNAFNKAQNENHGWFGNQSFGIQTGQGFIGMTWSPNPQQTRTLTPNLAFYVTTGNFGANALASWNQISSNAAAIRAPADFQSGSCTVTFAANGTWRVTPGAPPPHALAQDPGGFPSGAHNELPAHLLKGHVFVDTLVSVHWDAEPSSAGETFLTGTITVSTALPGPCTYFVLSGVTFQIAGAASGTTVPFRYAGSRSVEAIKSLFRPGSQLVFSEAN